MILLLLFLTALLVLNILFCIVSCIILKIWFMFFPSFCSPFCLLQHVYFPNLFLITLMYSVYTVHTCTIIVYMCTCIQMFLYCHSFSPCWSFLACQRFDLSTSFSTFFGSFTTFPDFPSFFLRFSALSLYRTQGVEGSQPATESRRNEAMKMRVYVWMWCII